jgi:hypothetical protein
MNIPFAVADLASHVLLMCPLRWQDQFNLHEKGMTPVEIYSLRMSIESIERVCTQEKANAQCNKKASNKGKKENMRPGTKSMTRVLKKFCTEKHCNLCKKHGGVYTMHNKKDCCKYEKDGTEKANFHAAKKGRRKPNPAKHSF